MDHIDVHRFRSCCPNIENH
ncbi:MAG: hypothetical protein JNM93_00720 [Bacteriovoracaceae bacterium]|nr:hypothetical protein [Bacteriovoracaceae bacterium]